MPRPTSIEIDLDALRHNASQLKGIAAPRRFFAVVKADAYGHGAIECSKALETIADGLVVAILEEAVMLREAGVGADVIVLQGPHSQGDLAEFSRLDLWPVFTDHRQLAWLASMPEKSIERAWLKVDTGMHRLGFDLSDVVAAEAQLRKAGIADIALMSHFAESEVAGSELTAKQLANWQTLARRPSASFANSSALLQTMRIGDDIARIGYALYGGLLADPVAEVELKPVMSFRSQSPAPDGLRWERPLGITDAGRQPADHGSQPSPSVMVMATREAQATAHPLALTSEKCRWRARYRWTRLRWILPTWLSSQWVIASPYGATNPTSIESPHTATPSAMNCVPGSPIASRADLAVDATHQHVFDFEIVIDSVFRAFAT